MLAQILGEADAVLPWQTEVKQNERELFLPQCPAEHRAVRHTDGLDPWRAR